MTGARELEILVTSAIYVSLLCATLNPLPGLLEVHCLSPLRDVSPATIPAMVDVLAEWSARCETVRRGLEGEVERIKTRAGERGR